jgi:UDP-N-acetylmuramoyl-tripeptide--D-alanyl-D-alanine ligase
MTEILWNAAEAAKATNGSLVGNNTTWQATGLAMDSRLVQAGDIFIALIPETEGDKYRTSGLDGHDYVEQAFERGAVAAIVSRQIDSDKPQLIVNDTMEALRDLGHAARYRAPLTDVIAITGSVGKTGTRAFFEKAYAVQNRTHASVKSFNNSIGVPYSLATMKASSDVGVFEVGMNYSHEITPLSKQIAPTMAVITWVAPVHIENFDNGIDGVIAAKSEIFDGMDANGMALLPHDNDHYDILLANAKTAGVSKIYSFGEHDDADACLVACLLAANGTRIKASIMASNCG